MDRGGRTSILVTLSGIFSSSIVSSRAAVRVIEAAEGLSASGSVSRPHAHERDGGRSA